ncbi:heme peroxidase [Lophium mytilinum]|uniref:Peroxidase n=1 Tax=Lophium mytilinum TaxID=390894 RepID=A0A6A6QKZ1_9PEZI|nr:heme peroxidase [Lophium mytilinum]
MKSSYYQAQTNTQVTGAKLIASATSLASSSSTSTSKSSTITSSALSSVTTATTRASTSTTSAYVCTTSASGWEVLGDLKNNGAKTPVGTNITGVLTGDAAEAKTDLGYTPPGLRGSAACKADTCCIWSYIAADLKPFFLETDGTCNQWARRAVRLGFHDAAGWSKPNSLAGKDYGGADGSIALSAEEAARSENQGLADIIAKVQEWQTTYGVGMADLIQFVSNLGAVVCPMGPRVRTWVGRKDSSTPAPTGLLPDVKDSVDKIVCLFGDKTLSYTQLAALMGAHSTSQQFFVDPSKAGQPQDDTPGVWDTRYYEQHRPGSSVPSGVFQFASDLAIANDTRTKSQWTSFAISGRAAWAASYATAYVRLSLLGVNNMNNLTECSHVLPKAVLTFP